MLTVIQANEHQMEVKAPSIRTLSYSPGQNSIMAGLDSLSITVMKYTEHRLDRWKIALDIEMIQWGDLLDNLDNLIWWITSLPDHGDVDYSTIPSGLIDT